MTKKSQEVWIKLQKCAVSQSTYSALEAAKSRIRVTEKANQWGRRTGLKDLAKVEEENRNEHNQGGDKGYRRDAGGILHRFILLGILGTFAGVSSKDHETNWTQARVKDKIENVF